MQSVVGDLLLDVDYYVNAPRIRWHFVYGVAASAQVDGRKGGSWIGRIKCSFTHGCGRSLCVLRFTALRKDDIAAVECQRSDSPDCSVR